MGIAYRGILLGRIFQFDDADGYAIYKKQNVRATILTTLPHDKLIDATENIMVGMLEVDVLQAERIIPAITVCKIISVAIEQEGVLQGIIIVLAASVPQIGNNAVHLGSGQFFIFVLSGKKCPQVFFNKRVGIFPVNVIAKRILPMRLAEEFDGSLLKLLRAQVIETPSSRSPPACRKRRTPPAPLPSAHSAGTAGCTS